MDPNEKLWRAMRSFQPYGVRSALREGADANGVEPGKHFTKEEPTKTPLWHLITGDSDERAPHFHKEQMEMIDALLKAGADTHMQFQGMHLYQYVLVHPVSCPLKLFRALLPVKHCLSLNQKITQGDVSYPSLGYALAARDVGKARLLMQKGALSDFKLPDGQPAFSLLVRRTRWTPSLDIHRNRAPRHMVGEFLKDSESALNWLEKETQWLLQNPHAHDRYGLHTLRDLRERLASTPLSATQATRLAASTVSEWEMPLQKLLEQGADPNVRSLTGEPLVFALLDLEMYRSVEVLMQHPSMDMMDQRKDGTTLLQTLQDVSLPLKASTRADWISRVQHYYISQNTRPQLGRARARF